MTTWLVCLALCCAGPIPEDGERVNIQADDDPTRVVVRYRIAPDKIAEWQAAIDKNAPTDPGKWLSLRLIEYSANIDEPPTWGPAIFGSYEIQDGYLLFRPRFALARGAQYDATVIRPWDKGYDGSAQYDVPPLAPREPTIVERVVPDTAELPANNLKFQICFSRPMRQGTEVFQRIRLLDQSGKEISSPWRDIELWHVNAPWLTLYIHPGRIKQGVNLREEFGPVLEPGKSYTLVIDSAMRDASGAPLGKEYRKTFKAGPEVHKKVDAAAWKITVPKAGTHERVAVAFDRPIDSHGFLKVFDPAGAEVAVSLTHVPHEWLLIEFEPKEPWKAGTYRIEINPKITDVAGNTPHMVFDRDLEDRTHDPTEGPIERTFEIR